MRASSRALPFSLYNEAAPITLVLILSAFLGASPVTDSLDDKGRSLSAMREAQRSDSLRSVRLVQARERARARLLAAVRLDTNETSCLVSMRATRECLFSVPEFNQRAPGFLPLEFSDESQASSGEFITGIRNQIVLAREAEAFREYSQDAFHAQAEAEMNGRAPSGGNVLPDGIDSALVARIYREEWVSLARAQDRAGFDIYASTDSGLIDSLGKGKAKSVPWIPAYYAAKEVPEEWLRRWPLLQPNVWSAPIKTAFGYVLVKANRKSPTLTECLPLILQYAYFRMNAPPRKRDSAPQGKIAFQVSARLLPRAKRISGRSLREDSILSLAASRFPMRKMSSLDLPASAQAGILDGKPMLADYGYWWIDSTGAKPIYVDVPGEEARGETDSLMRASKEVLESKRRERISTSAEAAWRRDLEGKGLSEEKIQSDWIAANLIIRDDFRRPASP